MLHSLTAFSLLLLILCFAPASHSQPSDPVVISEAPFVTTTGLPGILQVRRSVVVRWMQLEEGQADWNSYADALLAQVSRWEQIARAEGERADVWEGIAIERAEVGQLIAAERDSYRLRLQRERRRRGIERVLLGVASGVAVGAVAVLVASR